MVLILVLFVTLIGGLLLSFGAQSLEFLLTIVGSLERVSWLSIGIFGALAAYWLIFAIAMYRKANIEWCEEDDDETEGSQPKNSATKVLVVGILVTFFWLLAFALTDKSAVAAQQFISWENEYSVQLGIAKYIGNLSLAFAAGMIFLLLTIPRKKAKKKVETVQEQPKEEGSGEDSETENSESF